MNPLSSIQRALWPVVGARVLTVLLGLASTALLARVLSAQALATYWLSISALGLVVVLAQTGVGQVCMSQASQAIARAEPLRARAVFGNSLALVSLLSLAVSCLGALAWAVGPIQGPDSLPGVSLVFVGLAGFLCSITIQLIDSLRAQQRLKTASWLAAQPGSGGVVPGLVLTAGLLAIAVVFPAGPGALKATYIYFLGGWFLVLLIAIFAIRRPKGKDLAARIGDVSAAGMTSIFLDSLPLLFGALAMFAITQADLWFVSFFLSTHETAAYGLASGLVKYVSAINLLLGALLPGLVGQLWAKGDRARLALTLVKVGRIGSAAAAAVMLIILIFGQTLITGLAGPIYASAWLPLLCLAIGHMVNAMLGYSHVVLVTAGVSRPIVWASAVSCIATLVSLAVLTPLGGMAGAALASGLGIIVYNVIICTGCIRATGISCHIWAKPFNSRVS